MRENHQALVKIIKKQITFEFENSIKNGLYGKLQKHIAYNSNKIDGSALTKYHTATLFDTGTIIADKGTILRAKDITEMRGHFWSFDEMLRSMGNPVSEELLKRFHYQLRQGDFEEQVASKMQGLLARYDKNLSLKEIANCHVEYDMIHPFQDGNGRTGRMLMLKQCLDNCHFPIVIEAEKKEQYDLLLQKAQKEQNLELFYRFLAQQQGRLRDTILEYIDLSQQEKDALANIEFWELWEGNSKMDEHVE